jgi:hypothetical protein
MLQAGWSSLPALLFFVPRIFLLTSDNGGMLVEQKETEPANVNQDRRKRGWTITADRKTNVNSCPATS